jgi:hypothetical protein
MKPVGAMAGRFFRPTKPPGKILEKKLACELVL